MITLAVDLPQKFNTLIFAQNFSPLCIMMDRSYLRWTGKMMEEQRVCSFSNCTTWRGVDVLLFRIRVTVGEHLTNIPTISCSYYTRLFAILPMQNILVRVFTTFPSCSKTLFRNYLLSEDFPNSQ